MVGYRDDQLEALILVQDCFRQRVLSSCLKSNKIVRIIEAN